VPVKEDCRTDFGAGKKEGKRLNRILQKGEKSTKGFSFQLRTEREERWGRRPTSARRTLMKKKKIRFRVDKKINHFCVTEKKGRGSSRGRGEEKSQTRVSWKKERGKKRSSSPKGTCSFRRGRRRTKSYPPSRGSQKKGLLDQKKNRTSTRAGGNLSLIFGKRLTQPGGKKGENDFILLRFGEEGPSPPWGSGKRGKVVLLRKEREGRGGGERTARTCNK